MMIDVSDLINGSFEFIGALAVVNNIRVLYNDKAIKGFSVLSSVFFLSWGYWNLVFYPHLNQWLSFVGGCCLAICNTIWIIMMGYYKFIKKS